MAGGRITFMPTPEEQAREIIDQKLIAAGWVVQDYKQLNLGAGSGWSGADEIEKELDQALTRHDRLRQSILKRAFEGKLVGRVEGET
jgi:hypothetical protein